MMGILTGGEQTFILYDMWRAEVYEVYCLTGGKNQGVPDIILHA
jgi:hypothetical protein